MARIIDWAAGAYLARAWRSGSPALRRSIARTVTSGFEQVTYERMRDNGLSPDGVIDVGANRGDWSRMARAIFPRPTFLLIEAQSGLEPDLARAAVEVGNADYRIALLGPMAGEKRSFFEMGTGSSLLSENSNVARVESVLRTETLDMLAEQVLPDAQSLFLKLDVQGAELLILAGGEETLARSAAVQLEVALLPYNSGAPLLDKVIALMADRGFFVTEIAGFSRPGEHLVQVDLIFAPSGSSLRPGFFHF